MASFAVNVVSLPSYNQHPKPFQKIQNSAALHSQVLTLSDASPLQGHHDQLHTLYHLCQLRCSEHLHEISPNQRMFRKRFLADVRPSLSTTTCEQKQAAHAPLH